ncbi:MAG: heme-binding protein [Burkholderiales bacterium]|nr:heme-binding protein [Burkholderiales bacterium]
MRTRPALTLDDVKAILAAAEAHAVKNQWRVAIAVLDDGGHLLGFARMDGATPANAEIALRKGRTAATTRRTSKNWEDRVAGGRLSMLRMPVLPVQGGLPIFVQGDCVGGIGVSGVQSHEDEQIAQAGIDAVPGAKSSA